MGRPAADHRRFRNAGFGIRRPGAPGRDLPPDSGDGKNTHRRFRCGRDRGIWAALWAAVRNAPDGAAERIEARPIRVPPPAAGAQGGHPQRARTQGGCMPSGIGSRTRRGRPDRLGLTPGTRADCPPAVDLMAGREAEYLVADRD